MPGGYNQRKNRANAFWGDNYHATLLEDGEYLWQCLSCLGDSELHSKAPQGVTRR